MLGESSAGSIRSTSRARARWRSIVGSQDTLLRSLEAIHLTTANIVGHDLRAVVTYDGRIAEGAATLGITVEAPA